MICKMPGHRQIKGRIRKGSDDLDGVCPARAGGIGLIGCALVIVLALGASSVCAADCDRTCLKGLLDQYLNAVVQHNPAMAPLTPGYRQTENAVVGRPGQGIWQTAKALGKVQRRYMDPIAGSVAFFGTLEEQ